jgi:SWI/SNF-related matrix-associated actin-dependent regulator of chromatin subfamily A3
MLSLIIATKNDNNSAYSRGTLISTSVLTRQSRATLILLLVVPLSIISNWEKQIQDHCTAGTLKTIVYYDKTRGLSTEQLATYDIVITTYHTVTGEHANADGLSLSGAAPPKKKKKTLSSLFAVQWKVYFCLIHAAWI